LRWIIEEQIAEEVIAVRSFSGSEDVFREFWYPIWRADRPLTGTKKVEALGRSLAVYGFEKLLCAIPAECPHRGADLSSGTVDRLGLTCPYHGLRFDYSGTCVGQSGGEYSSKAKSSINVGLDPFFLWAALESPRYGRPKVEDYLDIRRRHFISGPIEWTASAPQIVDNFLDVAHFPYVHTETFSGPDLKDGELRLTDEGEFSFSFTYRHRAKRVIGGKSTSEVRWSYRTLSYSFIPPFNVAIKICYDDFVDAEDQILLLVVPIAEGKSYFFKIVSAFDRANDVERNKEAALQQLIADEDRQISEALPRRMSLDPRAYLLNLDKPGSLLRQKYAKLLNA